MAQPAQVVYTTTGSETAQPMMTYQPVDAAQPITYASEPGPVTYVDASGQPIQYITQDAGMPMTYTSSPYTMSGGYTYPSMPATYMPAMSGLDHSQGKWFAPGEALPPGFVVTAHPEGHTAPQETHSMTDKARESFVVTGSSLPKAAAPVKKSKKDKKKKKSSGCC
ncbi:unnamed protein product [Symbiodinium sp. CCMP2592]|nr:unnamed protein product [Symbiodinium sp. CCMP2592]